MEIKKLYIDKDIIVCEKPVGMLAQRDTSGEDGLAELLQAELGGEIHPISRLDRPVGGLTLLARSRKAAAALSAAVGAHTAFVKEYLACVSGTPEKEEGILEDELFRDRASGRTFAVQTPRKGTKHAALGYRLLKTADDGTGKPLSLIKIRLFTGRTHQIRAQFSSRGMPIAGDGKYGSRLKCEGIALRCCRLCFKHPISGKRTDISLYPEGEPIFGLFGELSRLASDAEIPVISQ